MYIYIYRDIYTDLYTDLSLSLSLSLSLYIYIYIYIYIEYDRLLKSAQLPERRRHFALLLVKLHVVRLRL